jgi:hypothetical protein
MPVEIPLSVASAFPIDYGVVIGPVGIVAGDLLTAHGMRNMDDFWLAHFLGGAVIAGISLGILVCSVTMSGVFVFT